MRRPDRATRFWRWLAQSPDIDRVVRVKSLMPHWDAHCGAVGWPTLLVEASGIRQTITPIWDRGRLLFWKEETQ